MCGGLFDQDLFDTADPSRRLPGGKEKMPTQKRSAVHISARADIVAKIISPNIVKTQPAASDTPTSDMTQINSPAAPAPVRSVSEVNNLIGRVLQSQLPPLIRVRGEISNFSVYSKGHAFFKLKDTHSELPCMMWRNDLEKLRFHPADGLAVIAEGAVKLYESQGRLQLYVGSMIPQGAGELELAFRQLCEKLRAQGLFDPARKKPIPSVPLHIAVITSATGDVFHDVLTTACRRFPTIHIMLFPVQVQGASAADDIVRAIGMINAHASDVGGVDLILLVRGGGSLEDLWAFNEESVARAIVQSAIPIATGIGHEPDVTIADLVADLRGPTPTGVAAMVIPEKKVLQDRVSSIVETLRRDMAMRCRDGRNAVALRQSEMTDVIRGIMRAAVRGTELAGQRIAAIEPRHAVAQGWRRVDHAADRLRQRSLDRIRAARDLITNNATQLQRFSPRLRRAEFNAMLTGLQTQLATALRHYHKINQQHLMELEKQLELAGPMQVLNRGYTITTNARGMVVKHPDQVQAGESIATRTAAGSFGSVVSVTAGNPGKTGA